MTADSIKRKLKRGEYPVYQRKLKAGTYWYGNVRLKSEQWRSYNTGLLVSDFTKRDAMDHVKAMQEELDAGRDPFRPDPPRTGHTVSAATHRYLKDCEERNRRSSTVRSYGESLRRFQKVCGDIPLAGINRDHVHAFRTSLSGLSLHTVNIHLANLRAFLRWVKREAPEYDWQPPEVQMVKTDPLPFVDYYNIEECRKLLAASSGIYLKDKQSRPIFPMYPLVAVLMMSGLRKNEAGSLHWEPPTDSRVVWPWVDLTQNQIAVPAPSSKSRRIRYVPLLPELVAVFNNWPVVRRGRLFPFSMDSGSLNDRWTQVCRSAGVKRLKIHCLRDTFAVNLLLTGVPLVVVMEILGHEDESTTKKYYAVIGAHELKDSIRRAFGTFTTPLLPKNTSD